MARQKKAAATGSKTRRQPASETHSRKVKQSLAKPTTQPADNPKPPTPKRDIGHDQNFHHDRLTAVIPSEPLKDPKIADNFLKTHDIHSIIITAGCKIEAKVKQVLATLKSSADSRKPVVIVLLARAPAANKCISIAEISKREQRSVETKKKLFQYTGYWARLEQLPLNPKPIQGDDENEEQSSDDGFEPMASKVRNTPCLAIYLSTKSVSSLKALYGEQVVK